MIIEYTPDVLKKVQKIELEMLLEVDKICKKYSIQYTICGGTLLGAVRHQGFIPWDDDLDIDMMRPDYEKFLEIAEKELSSDYFIQNYKTDKYCLNASFTKIRKNGTTLESIGQKHLYRHKGICIDIFPIDIVPSSKTIRSLHKNTLVLLQRLVAAKLKYNYYNERFPKKQIKHILSFLLKPISIYSIGRTMDKIRTLFKNSESTLVANTYNGGVYDKWTFDKNIYGTPILLEFEGYKLPAPEKYEYFLTQFFGDYMTPPPKNKRWNSQHNVVKLDIGDKN